MDGGWRWAGFERAALMSMVLRQPEAWSVGCLRPGSLQFARSWRLLLLPAGFSGSWVNELQTWSWTCSRTLKVPMEGSKRRSTSS